MITIIAPAEPRANGIVQNELRVILPSCTFKNVRDAVYNESMMY